MLSSIPSLGSAATIASLVALLLAAQEVRAAEGERAALLARGWAAPSLTASVRERTRERFGRLVLDGNVERGMPPYRTQPVVVAELDAIYVYLLARAQGEVGPGNPSAAQGISPATLGSRDAVRAPWHDGAAPVAHMSDFRHTCIPARWRHASRGASAAPSLIGSVREATREHFGRLVLDGNIGRSTRTCSPVRNARSAGARRSGQSRARAR